VSLKPLSTLDQLAADPAKATTLPMEVVEALLAECHALQGRYHVVEGALLARLVAARAQGNIRPEAPRGQPLVVGMDGAAKILGMSKSTLEKKWRGLGMGAYRDPADGRVKFPLDQLQAYIRRRQGR